MTVVACEKKPEEKAYNTFVEMCQSDPRAKEQGFDCNCQADILKAVLKDYEMTNLVTFLEIEKQDKNKAIEIGKDPKYLPMFQKIGSIGFAIHDKCGGPNTKAAQPAAQAPAAQAPAAQQPAAAAPAAPAAQ